MVESCRAHVGVSAAQPDSLRLCSRTLPDAYHGRARGDSGVGKYPPQHVVPEEGVGYASRVRVPPTLRRRLLSVAAG